MSGSPIKASYCPAKFGISSNDLPKTRGYWDKQDWLQHWVLQYDIYSQDVLYIVGETYPFLF